MVPTDLKEYLVLTEQMEQTDKTVPKVQQETMVPTGLQEQQVLRDQ
jgi:hypothetical protein